MFYKLLGMAVWNAGKLFVRRKYVSTSVPKPLLAGAAVAVAGGIALAVLAAKRAASSE
jgi:hypothetical protein